MIKSLLTAFHKAADSIDKSRRDKKAFALAITAIEKGDAALLEEIAAETPHVLNKQGILLPLVEQRNEGLFNVFLKHAPNPNPPIFTEVNESVGPFLPNIRGTIKLPLLCCLIKEGNAVGARALINDDRVNVTETGFMEIMLLEETTGYQKLPLPDTPLDLISTYQGNVASTTAMGELIPPLKARMAAEYRKKAAELEGNPSVTAGVTCHHPDGFPKGNIREQFNT